METLRADAGGLLLVDKPAGITSHDVVAKIRRALHTRRVGHTGTLDPFATGLLVVLVGKGTRLIPYVNGDPKVYDAVIRLGVETDTDDLTGAVVREAGLPEFMSFAESITRLSGEFDQVPPAYSAKRVGGKRAYAAARQGEPMTLEPVRVFVHSWEVGPLIDRDIEVRVTCNGGTYIRALARDLGRLSGSAAHLRSLRRIKSGAFSVGDAVTLEEIEHGSLGLRSLRSAISDLPAQLIDSAEYGRVVHGNPVAARTDAARVALVDDEETLIAVADRDGDALKPALVLRDA